MTNRAQLDAEMQAIFDELLRLSSLVQEGLTMAFDAVVEFNTQVAQDLINRDHVLNELAQSVEYRVERTVALQQPAARDLRIVIASMLIATELERMGDHVVGLARTILHDDTAPSDRLPDQLVRMREILGSMLDEAMLAFSTANTALARQVADRDDEVDTLYHSLFTDLVNAMSRNALPVPRGTYLLWAGHNMERIGDRVTNICERTIYATTGQVDDLNLKKEEVD